MNAIIHLLVKLKNLFQSKIVLTKVNKIIMFLSFIIAVMNVTFFLNNISHDLDHDLYFNQPVQKCSLSDPRRTLVYKRFLGILILSFCHREFFLFK
jgi:hypothetical protein